ncbi:hypothetical protein K2173_009807 [Erythroxylum novogranatense]|uniref:WIT1/2 N-terminal helical bundle domain-containing protein n=1 Tax=Erythroxylum novogranatense TaxID=1862640 RepID=A0AAV8SZX8_9ROSI|nr:hypothetical protein K2173_009807 [Erythroxylum novogranatense]
MEKETLVSPEVPVKAEIRDKDNPIEGANGDLPPVPKEGKKDDDETDGEFIKVEKESLDVKDGSHKAESTFAEDKKSSVVERIVSFDRDLLEAQEKIKELELELERVAEELKHSESESRKIKDEVLLAKEKLEESEKSYEELELSHRKLQEQISETEEKYSSHLNNLQDAIQAQADKHKELIEVKEAFGGLSLELENSRKKMQELENELQVSVGETKKFEELHKQSGSHAESEMQRALELERLLEVTKLSAKEMEDQMTSLQEEVKALYEKITENKKVEEALKSTTTELSAVKEELALSKAQLLDVEQTHSLKEALVNELTQELDLKKASESQVKDELSALQRLLTATKEDLQAKASELEDTKLKLEAEVNARELVEAGAKSQEAQVSTVLEELATIVKEKEALEATVADLTNNAAQLKKQCQELEEKLKVSDGNFNKDDSLLSQALSNNVELEQKLKSLEDLHNESGVAATTATQRKLELEDLMKVSNESAEQANSQLRELESHYIVAEQRILELEQQLNLVELKSSDAEREVREFSEKAYELSAALKQVEDEKNQLIGDMQGYKEKISNLESALNESKLRNSELENELKISVDKCANHENQANTNHQCSLELEDLFQISHSKAEDAGKKVNELELLLEAEKYRIQELEEQISTLEKKCLDAEVDCNKYAEKISEVTSELEAFQLRASNLETALQVANDKERDLTECLNSQTDEKKRLLVVSINSSLKLVEAENNVEILRNELTVVQEKLQQLENGLKAAETRETTQLLKLKISEEQLEQQEKLSEHATASKTEVETLHELLTRDFGIKLQEAQAKLNEKDVEAKSQAEKLKMLDEQVKSLEGQMAEVAGKNASLKEVLDLSFMKIASSETSNEQLKSQILETKNKASNTSSESELLLETNNQLKMKIDGLEELLNSTFLEKETTAHQITSHMNAISDITDKHTRAIELHSATEARMRHVETHLQETSQKLGQKDEVEYLNEKINALKGQIKLYEEQTHEASAIADSRKLELDETLLKLKHLESIVEEMQTKSGHFGKESGGLAEANLKLIQDLASHESKLSDLEMKLSTALCEKGEVVEELQTSKKAIEDLTNQLTDEGLKLKSQISSVTGENNILSETYQNAKKELQSVIVQLKEQLKEQKANEDALKVEIESLKAQIDEKSTLQARLKELQEQMEANSQKELEREAALKKSLEDLDAKNKEVMLLDKQVKKLEEKLQLADAKLLKGDGGNTAEHKDGIDVKSRDVGSTISTPIKRKIKKKLEAESAQTSSRVQTVDTSPAMTFKFIWGVALISIVVGVILGKRY